MPHTKVGKATLLLLTVALGLFSLMQVLVATGQQGGDTLTSNLLLSIPALLAAACAIAMLITGLMSIIAAGERSGWVFLATAIGLLVAVFLIGEMLAPH